MNVLICGGSGGAGSWSIRGEQLGTALGATLSAQPTHEQMAWASVVVLVKKHVSYIAPMAWKAERPIVWDALDFWTQPAENHLSEAGARLALQQQITQIRPALTIGATQAMARAAKGLYLPHHHWTGLEPTPARHDVEIVAYEGNPLFLGRWRQWLSEACARRGWAFQINPPRLADADLVVAFRDREWDGWICREWKSGVKVVNAIAAGRPLISQGSAAVRELTPAGSIVEVPEELPAAFDRWVSQAARQDVVDEAQSIAPRYALTAVAEQYREILAAVVEHPSCTA